MVKRVNRIEKMTSVKRILNVGGSKLLLLPLDWVRHNADLVDGSYWVTMSIDGKTVEVTTLDRGEIERYLETLPS